MEKPVSEDEAYNKGTPSKGRGCEALSPGPAVVLAYVRCRCEILQTTCPHQLANQLKIEKTQCLNLAIWQVKLVSKSMTIMQLCQREAKLKVQSIC